jgi:aerobic-type carbon monoxide dehydrogenase small subunit (CoxS/CutS family)
VSGTVRLQVNGEPHEVLCDDWWRLLDLLRDGLRLTGTKKGCSEGDCGTCTVMVDDQLVLACLVPVGRMAGARVRTVEGLSRDGHLSPLQEAFVEHGASQCGFCTPGVLMAATALLQERPEPSADDVRAWLDGTLCRCGAHEQIVRAVCSLGSRAGRTGSTEMEEEGR